MQYFSFIDSNALRKIKLLIMFLLGLRQFCWEKKWVNTAAWFSNSLVNCGVCGVKGGGQLWIQLSLSTFAWMPGIDQVARPVWQSLYLLSSDSALISCFMWPSNISQFSTNSYSFYCFLEKNKDTYSLFAETDQELFVFWNFNVF